MLVGYAPITRGPRIWLEESLKFGIQHIHCSRSATLKTQPSQSCQNRAHKTMLLMKRFTTTSNTCTIIEEKRNGSTYEMHVATQKIAGN